MTKAGKKVYREVASEKYPTGDYYPIYDDDNNMINPGPRYEDIISQVMHTSGSVRGEVQARSRGRVCH